MVFIQSMLIFLLTGVNGELSYYLPPGLAEDRFLLDSSTGQLSTTVSLDREEQASYTLTGNSYTLTGNSYTLTHTHTKKYNRNKINK